MSTTGSGETGGDYSYDMAHEDVLPPAPEEAPTVATQGGAPTGTSDTAGDLSYDLAHEVPGSGG